jgi:general secretion pathway protein H
MTRISATGRTDIPWGAGARRAAARCLSALGVTLGPLADGRLRTNRAHAAPRRARRDSAQTRAGFTLVELMMTVAIIGLAAGAVMLTVPDPRPPVGAEAERFSARLTRAREEAVLANRVVAVEADAAGYQFSTYDGLRWSPLTDGPFRDETWRDGTTMTAGMTPVRVVFDPTGIADPARITLSRADRAVVVTVDGAGEVVIHD